MLPLRLILVRNIRAGSVWSHAKFSSSRDGGEKGGTDGNSSQIDNVNDKSRTNNEDADKSKQKETGQDKSRIASLKLNDLLHSMLKEETTRKTPTKAAENLALTKPKQRKKEKKGPAVTSPPIVGASVVEAVARELGGDQVRTQAELLNKIVESTESVQDTPKPTKAPINLSELIVGMKIDRSEPAPAEASGRAHQVRRMLASEQRREPHSVSASMLRRPQHRHQRESASPAGLNDGTAFGIFASDNKVGDTSEDMWSQLQQRELRLAVTHPPVNIFEEMILWTNQGKLWSFPINNEQGLDEEANVPFSEHVFLERHIEDWCPKRGPVRQFMELVCVGLSKNPYITVQAKKDHIEWYKQYFTSKQALLKEVGAIS